MQVMNQNTSKDVERHKHNNNTKSHYQSTTSIIGTLL